MRITIGGTTFETTQAQDEGLDFEARKSVSGLGATPPPSREDMCSRLFIDLLNRAAEAEDKEEVAKEAEQFAAKYADADAAKRAEMKAAYEAKAAAGK